MTVFLLDLWHDLREKRLWPVAVALLAGLVAVPVVLSKSAGEPAAPAPEQAVTAPEPKELKGLASVKLAEDSRSSDLNTFDPSDPFRPPKAAAQSASAGGSGTATVGTSAVVGGDAVVTSGGSGGTTTSIGGGTTSSPSGESFTGSLGGSVGGSRGSEPAGGGDAGARPKAKATQYTYVVDATFIANGRKRKVKRMERLDMLPHRASPLLLFLGVSANAGNAVFLVDSTLQAAGEGKCKPGNDRCAFLYIGPGSEHEFVNDQGDSYTLRIDEIRKVKVKRAAASKKKTKKQRAKGATGRASAHRRFVPPVLADLIVSTTRERRAHNRGRRR